jgi:broad specificity phosphatase PhoE
VRIILARHGNTFNPGDRVCWVGSQNDLPLVEQGVIQGQALSKALKDIALSAIYYAPLLRTKRFAEIAAADFHKSTPLIEDQRLTELDYGAWSGLTDSEIISKFGEGVLRAWTDSSVWPEQCGWSATEESITTEVKDFVSQIISDHPDTANVLVVSSNGRLRYFLKLIASEFEKRVKEHTFKIATGRVCLLDQVENSFRVVLWNEQPEALLDVQGVPKFR